MNVSGVKAVAVALSMGVWSCAPHPTTSQSWTFTTEYPDPASLALGTAAVRALQSRLVAEGYRSVSVGSHSEHPGGAQRFERGYRGGEPVLGDVEITVWWWSVPHPGEREIGMRIRAEVGQDTKSRQAWRDLRARMREQLRPSHQPVPAADSLRLRSKR